MKILIFGTGKFYQSRKEFYQRFEIQAFLDNDEKRQGMFLDNAEIIAPEKWHSYKFEYIIIISIHRNEMRKQLECLGVPDDRILDFTQTGRIAPVGMSRIFYHKDMQLMHDSGRDKRVLLLTHELSYTGAPLVLLQLAVVLRKNGYFPVILSPVDGNLKEDFASNGIPVIVEGDISTYNDAFCQWISDFFCVWANTLYFSYLINALGKMKIPVIWWLHEGEIAYPTMFIQNEAEDIGSNIHIYADGYIALNAAKKHMALKTINTLIYGVPDFNVGIDSADHKKTIFAVIATIAYSKGQDIFVDAVGKLTKAQREAAEFWIIGDIGEERFYNQFYNRIEHMPQIIKKQSLTHDELEILYPQLDVVVCSSREDSMPVVLAEGMMNRKVCIMPDRTGTASLVTQGKNGMIYRSGDPEDLASQMEWVLAHKERLDLIGEEARLLYDRVFNIDCFEKNVLDILHNMEG